MTYIPGAQAGAAMSRAADGSPSDGPLTAVAPVSPGPRRGYRARPADEISALVTGLAQEVAGAVGQALPGHDPRVVTLVTTPVAGWYPVLAAALLETAPQPHVPVRGITDIITAAAAVPPALDAMGTITGGLRRWVPGRSSSGHSPLLTESELGGLWLNAVVAALLQPGQQSPPRNIRVAGFGIPQADPDDSCYLLSSVVSATLTWKPRRRLHKSPDPALAQWLLISSNGNVIAGGIKNSPR